MKLLILDIDGTVRDRDTHIIFTESKNLIKEAGSQGFKVCFCTNQGAVNHKLLRDYHITFLEMCKDLREVMEQLSVTRCVAAVGYNQDYSGLFDYVLHAYPEMKTFGDGAAWRKPGKSMIDYLRTAYLHPDKVIFVGDQDSDKQAAESAGIEFWWAKYWRTK